MDIVLHCKMKISVSCTWGDGPDVCVNINYPLEGLKNWSKGFFPLDFTGDEAIKIGEALIKAGKEAKSWDESVMKYFEGSG